MNNAISIKYVVAQITKDTSFKDPNGEEWTSREWLYAVGYYTPDGKWKQVRRGYFDTSTEAQQCADKMNGIFPEKSLFQKIFG